MNLCLVCQEPNEPDVQYCRHCGVELPSLPRSREGHLLKGVMLERRYEIGGMLGSGGFANAYLATDSRLKRACVVKEMLRPDSASAQEIRELERNFSREVQALVALNQPGHPNIPEIYDYFSSGSGNYLVMKYIQGQNLEDMLERSGALVWLLAVKIAIAVCDALVYMHARQPPVLHRDIKPANILIDQSERIWLVDFGLSKALPTASHGKSGTTALGTAGYTPLEQWMEMAVPASDIYALGATLHHLLTGHDPRDAFPIQPDLPQIRQEHGNFLPIRQVNESFPRQLEQLVSSATDSSPTKRPTAEQFKQKLEMLLTPAQTKAPQLFHFRNGKAASKPRELVPLSLEHWQEAREYLYHGPFQAWFKVLGRYDLESQVRTLILKEQIPDIALDKFLRFLDSRLPPPDVDFIAERTNFGDYDLLRNLRLSARVRVTNYGPGCFYGTSQLQQGWLKVYPKKFVVPPKESQDFIIQVQRERLVWNTTYQNQLIIDGNSEQKQFPLILHTSSQMSAGMAEFGIVLGLLIFSVIVFGVTYFFIEFIAYMIIPVTISAFLFFCIVRENEEL